MSETLVTTVEVHDGTSTISLNGRLDVRTAKEAEQVFMETAETSDQVILDLSELVYIASAGLRAVKRLHKKTKEKSGKLIIRNPTEDVMEIFEMTGFVAMLTFE